MTAHSDAPLDPVSLAADLMRIDSTSGREGAVIAHVHRVLESRGWHVGRIPVSEGRDDVLATAGTVAPPRDEEARAPYVTLSTHLDTVPPFIPPRVQDGRLWGRGACDAKGIAAAMICAAERLRARDVPVALLFVVGEETCHDGAHAASAWAAAHGFPTRALVNGEPTESTLALGTKGAVRVVVRTEGEAAHSAYPHLGRSAISALVDVLHDLPGVELPSDPLLGETTVNIGAIAGGVADNVIAPAADARLMLRIVSPVEDVMRQLRSWAAGRAQLEEGISVPPVRLSTVPGFPTSVVAFATDIPQLGAWGTPYLFGPGSVRHAHRDDEHVEIAELVAAVDAYERLAEAVLRA